MRVIRWVVLWVSIMLLSACASSGGFQPGVYTVQPQDTLYSIAWRFDANYKDVARWNNLGPPYRIYVGQKLRLSANGPKIASNKSATSKPSSGGNSSPSANKGTRKPKPRTPQQVVPISSWSWPTDGKVIKTFSAAGEGKKGINIAGRAGQPIVAASAGKVVYSGEGLVGYGRLVIINHNKSFLSAYAHNKKIFVKEGDTVNKGQKIAEMGRSGADRDMLHFEIRINGKPVDPLKYLPKK